MKLFKKANDAINLVKESLNTLVSRKNEITAVIASKNAEIDAFYAMPVCLDDYCSLLDGAVKAMGHNALSGVCFSLSYSPSMHRYRVWKNSAWKELEDEEGIVQEGMIPGVNREMEGEIQKEIFKHFCFFFPELVAQKLAVFLKENLAEDWGNNDYPSLNERREKIAVLRSDIAVLEQELGEVNEEINRIDKIVEIIPRPEPVIETPRTGVFVNEDGLATEIRETTTGEILATIK
ncbi:hypothetical protein CE195_13375 [Sodalis-like symbiont of Philaenus spumarius]|nr:hypothetical protein CE195_13375 [Sodalis-like symbiont of Philaenus spumarius]